MTNGNDGTVRALRSRAVLKTLGELFELSRGRARCLLALAVIAITVLALSPQQSMVIDTGWDKLNHVLAFAVLGFLALAATERSVVLPLLGLLGYGAVLELVQGMMPPRVASPADLAADALGLLTGWLLHCGWRVFRQRRGAGQAGGPPVQSANRLNK